jgi:hypothetical protein
MSTPPPRPTPFALALPGPDWIREHFGAMAREARSRGSDPADPGAFLLLAQVGATLEELRPGGAAGPESFHAFGRFLFHAFHLFPVDAEEGDAETPPGGLVLDVEVAAARGLVDEGAASPAPPPGSETVLPAPHGYLRLPRHLFWARPDPEGTPEAVDGVAWSLTRGRGGIDQLAVLAVTGVVPGREGFSVIPVPPVPLADAGRWASEAARAPNQGADFSPTLPGGELGELYSVETAGELLKLVARALAAANRAGALLPGAPLEGLDRLLRVRRLAGSAPHAP